MSQIIKTAKIVVLYVRQKITIELIYPLTECCHIDTHGDLTQFIGYMNTKRRCVETLLQMLLLL